MAAAAQSELVDSIGLRQIELFRHRIGYDSGATPVEDTLAWASEHDFHYIDFNADRPPNILTNWSDERVRAVRQDCERHDIHLGLHTQSSINVAEYAPYLSEAVDEYLRANIDLAVRLGCDWVEVHAGYHFSSNRQDRMASAIDRLKRTAEYAQRAGMQLMMENLNFEPGDAEVHYLAHNIEECRYFFSAIDSSLLRWAFTVNHAHLVPEGIKGFLDAFGIERLEEVRLADSLGDRELHLLPGQGSIDFAALFTRLEGEGFSGHYMMALGNLEEKLAARDYFVKAFEQ
jgi:sugar phosphate isomerase/epimerase